MRVLKTQTVLSRRLSGICKHAGFGGIFIEGVIPHGTENPQERQALTLSMRKLLSSNRGAIPQGLRSRLR